MKRVISVGMLVLAGLAPVATAQPPAIPAQEPAPEAAPQGLAPIDLAALPQAVEPTDNDALDLGELAELRGGETIAVQGATQNLNAVNAGNTVTGHTIGSGDMNINANAFNGYEGIGNFVINTGHNNNLMGSVSVNVMVTPQ